MKNLLSLSVPAWIALCVLCFTGTAYADECLEECPYDEYPPECVNPNLSLSCPATMVMAQEVQLAASWGNGNPNDVADIDIAASVDGVTSYAVAWMDYLNFGNPYGYNWYELQTTFDADNNVLANTGHPQSPTNPYDALFPTYGYLAGNWYPLGHKLPAIVQYWNYRNAAGNHARWVSSWTSWEPKVPNPNPLEYHPVVRVSLRESDQTSSGTSYYNRPNSGYQYSSAGNTDVAPIAKYDACSEVTYDWYIDPRFVVANVSAVPGGQGASGPFTDVLLTVKDRNGQDIRGLYQWPRNIDGTSTQEVRWVSVDTGNCVDEQFCENPATTCCEVFHFKNVYNRFGNYAVVAWQYADVSGDRIKIAGFEVGNAYQVLPTITVAGPASGTWSDSYPEVAVLDDKVIVTWQRVDDDHPCGEVYYQVWDVFTAMPLTDQIAVSDTEGSCRIRPSIAKYPADDYKEELYFAIAWSENPDPQSGNWFPMFDAFYDPENPISVIGPGLVSLTEIVQNHKIGITIFGATHNSIADETESCCDWTANQWCGDIYKLGFAWPGYGGTETNYFVTILEGAW